MEDPLHSGQFYVLETSNDLKECMEAIEKADTDVPYIVYSEGDVLLQGKSGADSLLHMCVKCRNAIALAYFVDRFKRLSNEKKELPQIRDKKGHTALMLATELRYSECVELLAGAQRGMTGPDDKGQQNKTALQMHFATMT